MSDKRRKLRSDLGLFTIGAFIIGVSSILSLVLLPFFVNPRISDLEYHIAVIQEEIDTLDNAVKQKDEFRFQSAIGRIHLDIMTHLFPEGTVMLTEIEGGVKNNELSALRVLAKAVLDDVDYQQQSVEYENLTWDQIGIEEGKIMIKFDDLKNSWNTQMFDLEQELIEQRNFKDIILYVMPVLVIGGTIVSQISAFRKIRTKD